MDQLTDKYYYILDPNIFNKEVLVKSSNFENALKKYCIFINSNVEYYSLFKKKIKEVLSIKITKCITSNLIKQVLPIWGLGSYIVEDSKFNNNSRGAFIIVEEISNIQLMVIKVTDKTIIL